MKTQYAVFEKVPAHGSKPNGVILCSYNTKEEAQSAGEKYGYNTDNYYVGEYNWKLDMTTDRYYQLADYILNHYDKTSDKDKLCLAKKLKGIYNSGLDTAVSIVNESCGDKETVSTLTSGLENSRI